MNSKDKILFNRLTRAQAKNVRKLLKDKKERLRQGLFVAEGYRVSSDLKRKGIKLRQVIVDRSFLDKGQRIDLLLETDPENVSVASDRDFSKISSLNSSQGILGIFQMPKTSKDFSNLASGRLLVLLENIQDPGNMGAIIRAVSAFSADGIILLGENADIYNPKVVRSSAGSILDIPISIIGKRDLEYLKDSGFELWASQVSTKAKTLDGLNNAPNGRILAFGSEGKGLSDYVLQLADKVFMIPINDRVESLNVAVAVAISVYALKSNKR